MQFMRIAHDARQDHRLRSILTKSYRVLGDRQPYVVSRFALFHVSCEENNSLMDHPIDCICVCADINVYAFTLTSSVASEQKGIDYIHYITRSRHAARWRYGDYVTAIRRVSKTRAHTAAIYLPFFPAPTFPSPMFIMLQLFCDSGRLTAYTRCTNLCDRYRAVVKCSRKIIDKFSLDTIKHTI